MIDDEVWAIIPDMRNRFAASTHGRIKRLGGSIADFYPEHIYPDNDRYYPEHIYALTLNAYGYPSIKLSIYDASIGKLVIKNFRVHRLVAMAHLGKPPSRYHQVNHIDGNRKNNHIKNLEWCLPHENARNAQMRGAYKDKEGRIRPRKPVIQFNLDSGDIVSMYPSLRAAGKALSVEPSNIKRVCSGKYRSCAGFGWKFA